MKNKVTNFPKKILLLSPVPPCSNYSGGLVLEHLARFLPKGSLVCFAVMNKELNPLIPPELSWIPVEYYDKPNEAWPPLGYRIGTMMSLIGEAYTRTIVLKKITEKIVAFGKKHKIDYLWVILDGQSTINLAVPVAKKLGIPMVTEIWDPPEWYMKVNNLDKISKAIVRKNFASALRLSQKLGAASYSMAKEYNSCYGVDSIPFLPSIGKNFAYKPAEILHKSDELIIAVAGQLYSAKEWLCLIEALHLANWKIAGRKVKIRLLGNWIAIAQVTKKMNIEYLGWCSQKETINIMNSSDVLYCPYMFDRDLRKVAELSFPSKLTTYLASGRPVLFHGPKYASPNKFLVENKAALCCNSLDPKEVLNLLKKLAKNPQVYSQLSHNGLKAFEKYLTMDTLHKNFAKFLEIDEGQLIPYEK